VKTGLFLLSNQAIGQPHPAGLNAAVNYDMGRLSPDLPDKPRRFLTVILSASGQK